MSLPSRIVYARDFRDPPNLHKKPKQLFKRPPYVKKDNLKLVSRSLPKFKPRYSKKQKFQVLSGRPLSYEQRMKKFIGKVRKTTLTTQPYKVFSASNFQSVISGSTPTLGNSEIFTVEAGLSRYSLSTSGIWDPVTDDISFAVQQASGGIVNTAVEAREYARDVHIDYIKTKTCIRNNTNVGVQVDVYQVKRKPLNPSINVGVEYSIMNDAIIEAINQSFNPVSTFEKNKIGYSEKITDFPEVINRFDLKQIDSLIMYPAMTKFYDLETPISGKTFKVNNALYLSGDPRWHRGLLFVCKGLPVHSSEDLNFTPGDVCYGAWKLDVLVSRKMKVRIGVNPFDRDTHVLGQSRVQPIATAFQEIQPAVNPSNATLSS